ELSGQYHLPAPAPDSTEALPLCPPGPANGGAAVTDERSHEMQPEPQRPLPSEFGAYISRFCEATATHDDMARLEHWLGQDDELLEQFLLTMEIHSSLSWQARSRSLASGDSGQSPAS